jgi:HEAT repeat protein
MGVSAHLPVLLSLEYPVQSGVEGAFVRSARGDREKDARTLAREILAMSDEDFRTAFNRSPMKRAKLRGLKRNAAVVLGNVGSFDDVDVLAPTLDDHDSLQREHAAWAISRLRTANAHQLTRDDAGHSLPRAESDRL